MIDSRKFLAWYGTSLDIPSNWKSMEISHYLMKFLVADARRVKDAERLRKKKITEDKKKGWKIKDSDYKISEHHKTFHSQEDICVALRETFGVEHKKFTQSALGKHLPLFTNQEILIDGYTYSFCKIDGLFSLREKNEFSDEFYELEQYFIEKRVHIISSNVFAFIVDPENYEKIKQGLRSAFTADTFFSIVLLENTMIVMVDKENGMYNLACKSLRGYFEMCQKKREREEYEKKLKRERNDRGY